MLFRSARRHQGTGLGSAAAAAGMKRLKIGRGGVVASKGKHRCPGRTRAAEGGGRVSPGREARPRQRVYRTQRTPDRLQSASSMFPARFSGELRDRAGARAALAPKGWGHADRLGTQAAPAASHETSDPFPTCCFFITSARLSPRPSTHLPHLTFSPTPLRPRPPPPQPHSPTRQQLSQWAVEHQHNRWSSAAPLSPRGRSTTPSD